MNRPRVAVIGALLGLGLLLTACQLPTASSASKSKTSKKASSVLVPFGSSSTDSTPGEDPANAIVSIPDTTPATTEAQAIEAAAEDTTPTAPPTTDRSQNPICKAAQRVVSINTRIDKSLTKAFTYTKARTLVRALRALPVTDLRNSYDDLSALLNLARRRKLAVVRDFTVDVGMAIVGASNVQALGDTIAKYEADPRAERAAINNKSVSKFVNSTCGFALTMIGDSNKK
jgi:hypothetical protein